MMYLVVDTSGAYVEDANEEFFIIGIFSTVKDALAARARYYATFPGLDYHFIEICPIEPNRFYTDRTPICDYESKTFAESEENLLYEISNMTD